MFLSILVVLYAKDIDESETIQKLSEYVPDSVKLKIYNNGPNLISSKSHLLDKMKAEGWCVSLEEDLDNSPLSSIYNDFINENETSDFYMILDDDSDIDLKNVITSLSPGLDLMLPIIKDKIENKVIYPEVNGLVLQHYNIKSNDELISISSGLVLSKKIINLYKKELKFVFDERFCLYGVDTSFFRNLNIIKAKTPIKIVFYGPMFHELSRLKTGYSAFRYKERLFDAILINRNYNNNYIHNWIVYIKVIVKCLIKKEMKWIPQMLNVIIKGKHPRSR